MRYIIIGTLDKHGYRQDNPKGMWLKDQQAKAKRDPRGEGGACTASFSKILFLPIDIVSRLKGSRDEQLKMTNDNEVVQTYKQRFLDKKYYCAAPISIVINYDGNTLINEGNHRTRACLLASKENKVFKYIPCEVSYFAGGELVEDGKFYPPKLEKLINSSMSYSLYKEEYRG